MINSIWPPHITVASVIMNADKFLIVEERIDGQLVYNQPAGHLEPAESLVQAAIRETLEETGWHYQPNAIIGIYLHEAANGITYQRVCFTGDTLTRIHDAPPDKTVERALWLSRAELVKMETQLRSPLVLKCIDGYLKGQRFPLSLLYDARNL